MTQGPWKFDQEDAPRQEAIQACVHCGLCLNACPTYRLLKSEPDSPRGRIYQIKGVAEGRIPMSEKFIEHIYLCLDCRACETACPSGVRFGQLMEAARGQIVRRAELPVGERLARWLAYDLLLPHGGRLNLVADLLRLYQLSGIGASGLIRLLPGRLRSAVSLLPPVSGRQDRKLPEKVPASGQRRHRVGFLTGCIMPAFFTSANRATVRVLSRAGCEVVVPREQVCCGALHLHAGERAWAKKLARTNIEIFSRAEVDFVITNSAGCGAAMKEYGHIFTGDPEMSEKAEAFSLMVRDVSEFLYHLPFDGPLSPVAERVAYHDPCHLAHAQGIRKEPRELLRRIPGIELLEIADSDHCCGSAGVYNINHPEMARELLKKKVESIRQVGPTVVATGNPGCLFQIASGLREEGITARVVHPVELLSQALP